MKTHKKTIYKNTINQQWREKEDLLKSPEQIVDSWKGIFKYKECLLNEEGDIIEDGLRKPQIGALHAFMADNQKDNEASLIIMPTGTGKTETMLSIMIAKACRKLLVIVPSDPLRTQVSNKFISLGLLPEIDVLLGEKYLYPKVGVVKTKMEFEEWKEFIKECNVVVTTMNILISSHFSVKHSIVTMFSNVFIDEAHHIEAKTWSKFASAFNQDSLTLFTATPFRNDGKKLRGKIIYNFSLREAQNQKYYKKISLLPIFGYTQEESDLLISQKAINQLRYDISQHYNHILMARCKDKKRAEEVFKYYEQETDLNPIVIHSDTPNRSKVLEEIKQGKHKIIVCVNMLGEGYDLPQLKIAALHDARKSLPIMLQFIGRFTRTSHSLNLGEASFIINEADPPSIEQLDQLYRQDADWNYLLPRISENIIEDDLALRTFLEGFSNESINNNIAIENITPAFSTLIYKVENWWYPKKCLEILSIDNWKYVKLIENVEGNIAVILLGREEYPEWTKQDITATIQWDIIIIHHYCTPKYCHGYINSSTKAINIDKLMTAVFGDNTQIIYGSNLFRVFYNMKRLGVTMFGGRKSVPGSISFKSFCGRDIEEGISQIEAGQLIRNNVFGIGYKDGERDSIGCTIKGKVWSLKRDNLYKFISWCHEVGQLIENASLDPDVVMRNALKVRKLTDLPDSDAIVLDWNDSVWRNPNRQFFIIDQVKHNQINWTDVTLETEILDNISEIRFSLISDGFKSIYCYKLNENSPTGFICEQVSGPKLSALIGNTEYLDIIQYFQKLEGVPSFFFANGDILQGTYLAELRNLIPLIDISQLIPLEWDDTILSRESQHILSEEVDYKSVQYFFSQYLLKTEDFDILYDDDGNGEIADLITIKEEPTFLKINLYHLKYATGGKINNSIKNLYEVCSQAIRSLKWHNQDLSKLFFSHLIDREIKQRRGFTKSRLIKGDEKDLHKIQEQARFKKKMLFNIAIVQPSISYSDASEEIRRFLGCISAYIEDISNIKLNIYCNVKSIKK